MDESGFFARLKLDEDGDEPTTGDDDDRRRLLATHSLIAEVRPLTLVARLCLKDLMKALIKLSLVPRQ
jgi:hypothetical protein